MIPLHDDNPTERPPIVTLALIAGCVLVFLWQASLDSDAQTRAVYALGSIPAVIFDIRELPPDVVMVPAWATVLTSMFLHGGWMHLLGNMLYLWIFGNNVEDATGHFRFVVFYLVCGTVAVFAQALPDPESALPMVGASGAISGVLGAYLLLFPHARVLVAVPIGFLIQPIYLPASLVLVFWFGLQLLSSWLSTGEEGGVAFAAHIGGFVAGLLFIPLFKRRGVPLLAPPRR